MDYDSALHGRFARAQVYRDEWRPTKGKFTFDSKRLKIEYLPSYLAAITRHAVYRYLVTEKRRMEKEEVAGRQSLRLVSGELLIDDKQLLEMVKRSANELPEKCRLVFIYNKIEDQALPEVAAKLNISLKTAEAHLTKALRLIRKKIGDHAFLLFINL